MKRLSILLVALTLLVGLPAIASETKKQTHCPICKMEINKDLYADYQGKRVYFGCAGCPDKFKANPDKYMEQMKEAGVELYDAPKSSDKKANKEHAQVYCICGADHVDYSIYTDTGGKRVFFCNVKCKDHFMKNPEESLKKMQEKGIKLEDAPGK